MFAVDGEKHVVVNPDPMMTLVEYLHSQRITSPKLGCGEGGCGACTLTIASWDASTASARYRSVNSCLLALCSCDGLSVTTSSGLGNSQKGFHPIQEALAEHNGSQCGFCSPGMVMSCFGMLSATEGEKCPDALKLESCIDGNLCRCTGYRPILEAFKSFAGKDKRTVAGEAFAPFPDFLKERSATALRKYEVDGKTWISPGTLDDLVNVVKQQQASQAKWGLVAGHTCRGIYKDDHLTDVFVSVSRVPELQKVEPQGDGIVFGAAVTWGVFMASLEKALDAQARTAGMRVLLEHARKVAGHSVRNLGTLGGNLAMTKRRGFASDLACILAGVGATVTVLNGTPRQLPVHEYFTAAYELVPDALLTSVFVPYLEEGELFKTYRTALRPINSHALTNAAFRVKMAEGKVASAHLIFGALESRESGAPIRASGTEAAIVGKAPDEETLTTAIAALVAEPWFPSDRYERQLSIGYLRKMFHTMGGKSDGDLDAPVLGVSQSSERPVTQGKQSVLWNTPEFEPIASAMPKTTSKLQAAGEMRYTSDLPEPSDCLFCAYVCIPRAGAIFRSFDASAAEGSAGFAGIVSAEDIRGANSWELTGSHLMLVPQGKASQYADQPCLLVVADSTKHAEAAARKVNLVLEAPTTEPALTVAQCIERQRQVDEAAEGPKAQYVKDSNHYTRGEADAAMAAAPRRVSGKGFCDGQKAFYMEPAAAIAIPLEDGVLNVWGSFQVPSWAHGMATKATGLPMHKIVMNAPVIGGGFGGKLFKAFHSVVASCIAAQKFGKPVKTVVNRNVDTVICGGRLPNTSEYEVGFDDTGKILAVKMLIYADAGQGDAAAGFSAMIAGRNMEQIYWLPNADVQVKQCITAKPGNTAVRGPGEPQATYHMETIIAHIAEELDVSQQQVREVNIFGDLADREKCAANPTSPDIEKYSPLFASGKAIDGKAITDFPALGIWMSLKNKVDFDAKLAEVDKFNAEHRWRKRGVSMTPVKYAVNTRKQQCLVNLYADGTCLITCDGSEIGQGLHTKMQQYAAYYLSQIVPGSTVAMDKVRVGPIGTDKVSHGSITGGSTTSEGVCEAVRNAIETLAENLRPVKEQLQAEGGLTFEKLLAKAGGADCELQASGRNPNSIDYHIYGACCSEVEVDVLTGETVIRSSSMLYDCGKSLNPTIDLGQCEGGFMMGVGFFLRERLLQDPGTGKLATDGTWEYKIPCFQDVPLQFDVEFFPRAFDRGIASSKASGEPPLVLSSSVFCAVREAIRAGRKEFGKGSGPFRLDAPATPKDIAFAIGAVRECW